MSSSFSYVVACIKISFILTDEQYSIVSVYLILFIQSFIDGHLSCFELLVILINAAINVSVQIYI